VMVDIDLQKLYAKGLSPADVTSALTAQNLILPAGTQKIGDREYFVRLNSSPRMLEALNDLPVKQVGNATITMRDVAQVRDGFAVQTNIVSQNGARAALLTVLKSANASTLDIIKRVREALPRIEATLPPALKISELFDQSLFVRAAIDGVLKEGLIAACLTALMILLFLGSWRSTLIVAVSIPLAIFSSIILLGALGQTLNIMTLGGLALAVGILVDDATVEIENIHRNLGMGKPMTRAILDGAHQVAVPAFVSTLCICIVFVPVFFLSGTAKFLFQPLAMGVIFAMLASYFLSRTVVPTMARFLLSHHLDEIETPDGHKPERSPEKPGEQSRFAGVFGWLRGIHDHFNHGFGKLREGYVAALDWALDHRRIVFLSMGALALISLGLVPFLGRDFFPAVDSGQFRLHCRAPEGTRLEVTEERFNGVAKVIREVVPADEVRTVLANIGLPASGINLAFSDNATISSADGEILVALNPEHHGPTAKYVRILRERLHHDFPDMEFSFSAPDIVSQILNFGLPAPIDIQITGASPENLALAKQIEARVAQIRGAADVHLQQRVHSPELRVNIDRARASQIGLMQQNVANTLLTSLSSSGQASPNFWLNFQNGVNYQVAVQTPQYKMDTLNALLNTPVVAPGLAQPELLGNLARIERDDSPVIVNHYNVQPVFDVLANAQDRDLGGIAADVGKVLGGFDPQPHWFRQLAAAVGLGRVLDKFHWLQTPPSKLPRGTFISVRGQALSMNTAFLGLGVGIVFAIVLVYSVMVVNFQSWTDPFVIISALPGALCGIVWMLFITGTTLSVPSLMGAIMAIGVATANSILLVNFANDERRADATKSARAAALAAGHTRLRPVLMTALAMIIGMLPMSLGLGEGGEQNAPLGRAVIGGLLVATFVTLFFVPVVYSMLRHGTPELDRDAQFEREINEGEIQEATS
jgi:multidrug efflux pump subunit AcrB